MAVRQGARLRDVVPLGIATAATLASSAPAAPAWSGRCCWSRGARLPALRKRTARRSGPGSLPSWLVVLTIPVWTSGIVPPTSKPLVGSNAKGNLLGPLGGAGARDLAGRRLPRLPDGTASLLSWSGSGSWGAAVRASGRSGAAAPGAAALRHRARRRSRSTCSVHPGREARRSLPPARRAFAGGGRRPGGAAARPLHRLAARRRGRRRRSLVQRARLWRRLDRSLTASCTNWSKSATASPGRDRH